MVLGGVSLTLAAAAPAERGALKVECKLAAIHYLGTTKQRQKVCLTLTADGKALRQYQFAGRFKCGDGSTQGGLVQIEATSSLVQVDGLVTLGSSAGSGKIVTKLRADGSFSHSADGAPSVFTGKVGKTLATGSLREHYEYGGASSGMATCDLGKTTWSARRAPR